MTSRRHIQRREFIRIWASGGIIALGAVSSIDKTAAKENSTGNLASANTLTPEMFGAYGDWNGARGTDDTLAMQKFFDALKMPGSRGVLENRYRITHTVFYGSRTHVSGNGELYFDSPADVPKGGGVALMPETYQFADDIHWVENCSFSNFTINAVPEPINQANGISTSKARNIVFDSLRGSSVYWHFLDLNGCKNVLVKHCVFSGAGNAAIQVDCLSAVGGSQALLSDNTLRSAAWSPIDKGWNRTENVQVSENKISDCFAGIHLHRQFAENVKIDNNHIRNCKKAIFDDGLPNWKNLEIYKNDIEVDIGSHQQGIILKNEYDNIIIIQ